MFVKNTNVTCQVIVEQQVLLDVCIKFSAVLLECFN
jgi:hypothetical protein